MSKKFTYEFVYNYFKENGYELLEKEYVDCETPMLYKCKCNNITYITFKNFKRGQRKCSKCANNEKFSYEYVKQYFEDCGCELLETEYINSHTNMKFRCKKNHITTTSLTNFKRSIKLNNETCSCKQCASEKMANDRKFSYQEIYDYYKSQGCELLEKEYKNVDTPMKFICECGEEWCNTFYSFREGQRCNKCRYKKTSEKERLPFDVVLDLFNKNNYILLEDNYINCQTPMKYQCNKGHVDYITYGDLKQGERCRQCYLDNNRGPNHPNWNPNLTEKDRDRIRPENLVSVWRTQVFQRDNYTCQICGIRGCYLEAHHLDAWHWCVEKRYDIDNGVTLCEDCHNPGIKDSFHFIYGLKNNTKEQFEEYKKLKNQDLMNSGDCVGDCINE